MASRPCSGRNGEKCELFWSVTRISEHCCQDCEGKILPPNQALPPVALGDSCGTTEHAVCKESLNSAGTLELTYTADNCCDQQPVGTEILENKTCSYRICRAGRPAYWERTSVFIGDCGCCEYESELYRNGDCYNDPNNKGDYCCCEGTWALKETSFSSFSFSSSTTTTTTNTTTTTITTTTSTTTTTPIGDTTTSFSSASSSSSSSSTTLPTLSTTTTTTSTTTTTTATTTPATTPIFVPLPQCEIESLSFALDISGSMNGFNMKIWKPTAMKLVTEMVKRNVSIDHYYLFTYVNQIQKRLITKEPESFNNNIANWTEFGGSTELTFAALKHALTEVSKNAFLCIWTDEIGDDTNDAALKSEILKLKASTRSEIFFMVITSKKSRKRKQALSNEKDGDDDNDKKRRQKRVKISNFEATFGDIGHVMDISRDRTVISKIIEKMKQSAICSQKLAAPTAMGSQAFSPSHQQQFLVPSWQQQQ